MDKPKLLIVEDDEDVRRQMRWALADEYEVVLAGDRVAALEAVRAHQPPVVTLYLGRPPEAQGAAEGFATLDEIRQVDQAPKVVVITGREEREYALRAVDRGAYDYFCKPIQVEELKAVLRRALYLYRLEQENRELQRHDHAGFEDVLGTSPQMEAVLGAVRKVAATDADLRQAMREGRFRDDLYYRIGVVVISVPPLRERGDDITLLATVFLQRCAAGSRRRLSGFTRDALTAIQAHAWPGNVRELENRVKRAVVMAEGARVTPADLELESVSAGEGRALRDGRAGLAGETSPRAAGRREGKL